jgi:hypothetical protein
MPDADPGRHGEGVLLVVSHLTTRIRQVQAYSV